MQYCVLYKINLLYHPADLPRMQCCTCVGKLMYLSASYWHQLLRMLDSEAKEYLYMGAPWRGCLNRTHHRPDTVSARIRFMNTRNWESLKRSPLPSTSVAPYERVITRSWRTPHVRYDACTRAKRYYCEHMTIKRPFICTKSSMKKMKNNEKFLTCAQSNNNKITS